jgi:hypothetical protein
VVKALDVLAVQEAQHPLLELTRALPRDDLNQGRLLLDRLVDDRSERSLDLIAPVVDVVQVELELHNTILQPPHGQRQVHGASLFVPQP